MYEKILRPILFRQDAETAHHRVMRMLRLASFVPGVASAMRRVFEPRNAAPVDLLGMHFPSCVGMAAGFDKDAQVLRALWGLGFGFAEVGSVTASAWGGNQPPRMRRLVADQALINRMGLPSQGVAAVVARLARGRPPFPILGNIAKTADPTLIGDAAIEDIRRAAQAMLPVCDALVLNLSCPNTEDGRTFEEPASLRALLEGLRGMHGPSRPMLVKVSPDRPAAELLELAAEALRGGIKGFVATNTTKSREGLASGDAGSLPPGGLSGVPLRDRSLAVVRNLRAALGPLVPIIGCGGISTAEDIDAFREAGADLVEAYTGFIYRGPFFVKRVLRS
jgi:dihydroorotate dehydrogenase